ncbi:carbonyl reductase [NADPH] 1 [Acipenser ruthenus]|uniref:carbonyl reductase [NADPH] 1 n=1 Tax=Acipenser ruthenus TaxID=7906 RepID=UPI00145B671B|nr:carbonyl reductase [NADPH] 1 [Acipenser ruthenus]
MSKKVALVTGANKGIGLAIVKGLCQARYPGDVIVAARSEALGKAAVEDLKKEGLTAIFHQLDITDPASVQRVKDFLEKNYGGVDVLINNAGIAFKAAATEPLSEQAEVTLHTNFFSTLCVCRALLPLVKPQGRVVNVSSFTSSQALAQCSPALQARFRDPALTEAELCALMQDFVSAVRAGAHREQGWPSSAYATSKLGLTALTRVQARQLSQDRPGDGILLNAGDPGWVRTDMAGSNASKSPEEGAQTLLYLALLPPGSTAPHGELVSEKKVQEW